MRYSPLSDFGKDSVQENTRRNIGKKSMPKDVISIKE